MRLYTKRITSAVIMMRIIIMPTTTVTATATERAVGLVTLFLGGFSVSITIGHYCTLFKLWSCITSNFKAPPHGYTV